MYESHHYDGVIANYRECMATDFPLRERIMETLRPYSDIWMDPHLLDLHQDGEIRPHLDHYAGAHIVGLSLLSDCIMRFTRDDHRIYAYLPRRSLYIQWGTLRYQFKHEILPRYEETLPFHCTKERRLSVLMRNPVEDQ